MYNLFLKLNAQNRNPARELKKSELEDLTGPAAATAARVVESLPKIFDDGNFMDTIEALSPGLSNPIKAVMGETRDRRRGRVAFRYETPGERIARATGARPIRKAIFRSCVLSALIY